MGYLDTRIAQLYANEGNLDSNMASKEMFPLLQFAHEQSPLLVTEDLRRKAFNSQGTVVKYPVMARENITIGNSRNCSISADDASTSLVSVTWTPYVAKLVFSPADFQNNAYDANKAYSRMLNDRIKALAKSIQSGILSVVSANKNTKYNDLLGYGLVGNAIQCPFSQREELFMDLNAISAANEFDGHLNVFGNSGIMSIYKKLFEKGANNMVNKMLELEDKSFGFTTAITNETGVFGTGYAIPNGQLAILTRVDVEAMNGTKTTNGHEFGTMMLPGIPFPVGYHYYETVGNRNAEGETAAYRDCVKEEHLELSVDVATLVQYNSDTTNIPNPIMKFEVLTSTASNRFATDVNVESSGLFVKVIESSGSGSSSSSNEGV